MAFTVIVNLFFSPKEAMVILPLKTFTISIFTLISISYSTPVGSDIATLLFLSTALTSAGTWAFAFTMPHTKNRVVIVKRMYFFIANK